MSWTDIRAGNYGWVGKLNLKDDGTIVDLTTYSLFQMIFTNPKGEESVKTAQLFTDGTDGAIIYQTQQGDVNQIGNWSVRARIGKTGVLLDSKELEFQAG